MLPLPLDCRLLLILTALLVALATPLFGQDRLRQEEATDYYEKWLNEDVVYIVTDEERAVFSRLTTEEEKERFIEQFWRRRNPNPHHDSGNPFKEEHYRRIAFANERFHAGIPGWRTDRGKIYIIHGPPDELKTYSAGSNYRRPMSEGGGSTRTYPMEVWRYRHIEGLGSDIVLEFVDRTLDGNYQLALDPAEKDVLLYYPTLGMTLAEEVGMANREDHPFFNPTNRSYPFMNRWGDDSPFQRYALYARVQAPPPESYRDFQRLVQVHLAYDEIPVQVQSDFFRLNEEQLLVPLTLRIENRDLSFAEESGTLVSRVSVKGIVSDMSNRIVTEFEDDLVAGYGDADAERIRSQSSLYQKTLTLEARGRYKLDLLVRDRVGGKAGIVTHAIIPPVFERERLDVSSLVLSDAIRTLEEIPREDSMFVLGDVRVRPKTDRTFFWSRPLGLYFQIYNAQVDQSLPLPSLEADFTIRNESGEVVVQIEDPEASSLHYASPQRLVLIRQIPLFDLPGGRYTIEVSVRDRVSGQEAFLRESFEVKDPPPTPAVEPMTETASPSPSP